MIRETERRLLTKSDFIKGISCLTKLYYSNVGQYASNDIGGDLSEGLKKGGFQVGELAKQYFDEGIQIQTSARNEAHVQTLELMNKRNVIIFEAVIFNDKFLVKPDIMQKIGDTIHLIEVKSKSVESINQEFFTKRGDRKILSNWETKILDIAFQTFVVREQFPDFRIIPYLMLTDKSKKTSVEGLNQMFKLISFGEDSVKSEFIGSKEQLGAEILSKIDVTSYVDFIIDEMEFDGKTFYEVVDQMCVINQDHIKPVIQISSKCKKCEYRVNLIEAGKKNGYKECWIDNLNWSETEFDKPHIFDIWKIHPREVDKFMNKQIFLMEDIDLTSWGSSIIKDRQRLQITSTLKNDYGKSNEIIDPRLFDEMKQWRFPLHFIDFETTMVAIPFNKNKRPYEQIVFQFSIHDVNEKGEVNHVADWLNVEPGIFPNYDFVRELRNILSKDDGTIFCFSNYENSMLNTIYKQVYEERDHISDFQDLLDWIRTVTYWYQGKEKFYGERHMVDMLKLVTDYYYHPLMKGSNSIKDVLPTIMAISDFIRKKYQLPYQNSRNYDESQIWYILDDEKEYPIDPYQLQLIEEEKNLDQYTIKQGGDAMAIYARLQFSEMEKEEREKLNKSLLKYCELDTLAMVMIYEHWNSLAP